MLSRLNKRHLCLITVMWGLLLFPLVSNALKLGPVTLHGFVNQLYVNTTDNNYFGSSTNGSWEYREAGLTGFYRLTNRSYVSARATASQISNAMPQEILSTQYAFLGFDLINNNLMDLGLRLGDLQRAHGLYSDAIDIPLNRNGIMLPQTLYYDYVRKTGFKYRGYELSMNLRHRLGDLELILSQGKDQTDLETAFAQEYYYSTYQAYFDAAGVTQSDIEFFPRQRYDSQIKLTYLSPDFRWKIGYSRTESNGVSITVTGTSQTTPYQLQLMQKGQLNVISNYGFEHYLDAWTFTFEYGTVRNEGIYSWALTQPIDSTLASGATSTHAEGYYLQTDYRFNPFWNAFVRFETRNNLANNIPDEYKYLNSQKTWVIGFGWEAFENFKLCAEYQTHDGAANTISVDNPSIPDLEPSWNLFGISASYTF